MAMTQKELLKHNWGSLQLNVLLAHILITICLLIGILEVHKHILNNLLLIIITDLVHRYIYAQYLAVDGNFKL